MIEISGKYGNLVYETVEPEPEHEPARVVYHGHHYVEVDGHIYVEPGYYAVDDGNHPGWIDTFVTKEAAQKWVEHLENEGCAPSCIYVLHDEVNRCGICRLSQIQCGNSRKLSQN